MKSKEEIMSESKDICDVLYNSLIFSLGETKKTLWQSKSGKEYIVITVDGFLFFNYKNTSYEVKLDIDSIYKVLDAYYNSEFKKGVESTTASIYHQAECGRELLDVINKHFL